MAPRVVPACDRPGRVHPALLPGQLHPFWMLSAQARSVAGRLPDQDDVDAAGQLLMDLEDLPDVAVLPVGGLRPGVLELQAVLVDPLPGGLDGGDDLLRASHEDDVGGAPGVGGELAA